MISIQYTCMYAHLCVYILRWSLVILWLKRTVSCIIILIILLSILNFCVRNYMYMYIQTWINIINMRVRCVLSTFMLSLHKYTYYIIVCVCVCSCVILLCDLFDRHVNYGQCSCLYPLYYIFITVLFLYYAYMKFMYTLKCINIFNEIYVSVNAFLYIAVV